MMQRPIKDDGFKLTDAAQQELTMLRDTLSDQVATDSPLQNYIKEVARRGEEFQHRNNDYLGNVGRNVVQLIDAGRRLQMCRAALQGCMERLGTRTEGYAELKHYIEQDSLLNNTAQVALLGDLEKIETTLRQLDEFCIRESSNPANRLWVERCATGNVPAVHEGRTA